MPAQRASSPMPYASWIPALRGTMTREYKYWQCMYEMDG